MGFRINNENLFKVEKLGKISIGIKFGNIYVNLFFQNYEVKFNIWTHFDNFGPRTNNHVEDYNSQLKKLIVSVHPNIFKFINIIKKEETLAEFHFNKAIQRSKAKRKIKDVLVDGKLKNYKSLLSFFYYQT